jgi:transposase-like protein
MLSFPIDELLDEQRCYEFLLRTLHPDGLRCPQGHPLPPDQQPHDRHRAPIMDYRCRQCGAVYNLFTGTCWRKTRYPCRKIVLLLRGIAQGVPTKHLAEELRLDRSQLLERRHAVQELLEQRLPPRHSPRPRDRSR